MSCNIEHRTYKDSPKLNRRGIEAELNAYVAAADYQEGASGLPQRLRWLDDVQPFATADEAENYLEEKYGDRDKYACVAVRFYDADREALKADKQYVELTAKRAALREKREKLANAVYIKTLKAKIVTCKECGCGIPTARWNHNHCPVCYTDLRPESVMKTLSKDWTAINQLDDRIAERQGVIAKKGGKVCWLVRFGYHT